MKIAFLGDIAFMGKYSLETNKNATKHFEGVSELLSKYDHVVGNLELPFTNSDVKYSSKSVHLKSSPINVDLLKFLHIDIVNLANNHIYDYGKTGLTDTVEILDKNRIEYFGVFGKDCLVDDDFNKIAMHGYCCYSSNPIGLGKAVNALDISVVSSKLEQYHGNGFLNILSLHFGKEHVNYPSVEHIEMAKYFDGICPNFLYGHHPHVIQGLEKTPNSLHAYSLGNFCFDDIYKSNSKFPFVKLTENNKSAIIVVLEFLNNEIVNYDAIPIYLGTNVIKIGDLSITEKLKEYSTNLLNYTDSVYTEKRDQTIKNYVSNRKSNRNLQWYMERMQLDSIRRIFSAKHNRYMYKRKVLDQVNKG
jgi:poly-gamma-glutamate synthesis protein (capsule biosynthesis protein)